MYDLEEYLGSFGIFTKEEIKEAAQLYTVRNVDKNYFFIREGKVSEEVGFIKSGIFRSFYTGDDANETTYCFRFPNEMITAYSSFITGGPSVESMQAITPAELLVIKKKDIEKISENINWIRFSKIIAEYEFIELENRLFQFQRNSAAERYKSLLENQPEYIKNIPLQYLASYLGISQRHLSRIRKEIF